MKIILSHPPGAGGSHIAGMLGNSIGKFDNTGAWRSKVGQPKLAEMEVIKGNLTKEDYLKLLIDLFNENESVLCTHQIDWPVVDDAKLIRVYWTKPSLSKYFCYRDINTLPVENVIPSFYSDSDNFWKTMMDVSVPIEQRAKLFLANHLVRNKNLIPGKLNLSDRWAHLCVDNILSIEFVNDLDLFCKENDIEFDFENSQTKHENWIARNGTNIHNLDTAMFKLINSSLFPK